MGLTDTLHIEPVSAGPTHAEAVMLVTPEVMQPYGFVHGGATLALLETAASLGAAQSFDAASERPFGVDVQVRHRKPGRAGTLRGVADLARTEPSRAGGVKQFWAVAAYDDEGDVVSEGSVMVKIVPLSRLEEKERERAAARERAAGE